MATVTKASAWPPVFSTLATASILAIVTGFLYLARPVLIPAALALLVTFMLGPVVLWLQRRGVPRVPSVLLVVAIAGLIAGLLAWLFFAQSARLISELPDYQKKVSERIQSLRSGSEDSMLGKVQVFVDKVTQAATRAENTSQSGDASRPTTVVLAKENDAWLAPFFAALGPLLEPLASAGLVFILVIYALIEREDLRDRLVRLIGRAHMSVTTLALDDVGQRISRYLLAQFLLNASFGVVVGVGLFCIGVPHALLWGILASFLRYIPVVGPWLAAFLPVSLSLMTSEGWLQPALAISLFVVFEVISNLVIEPWLYGQTMGVSQSGLIVAIAFWTWLWGPMGLVLAAPLTVCLMILGRYVPSLKFFDILLGDQAPLTTDVRFYQRLLAHDQDEASRIARSLIRTLSLQEVYDQLLIPTLTYARQDMEAGRLSPQETEGIWSAAGEIGEELGLLATGSSAVSSDVIPDNSSLSFPRICMLACAARDMADEIALGMFRRVLDRATYHTEIASTDRLSSEILSQVENEHPSIVCVAGLPPGGLAHTRLLCKRLRQKFPALKIIVGRWGLRAEVAENRGELVEAGADLMSTSLEETAAQLGQLAQYLRPAAVSLDKDSPGVTTAAASSALPAPHLSLKHCAELSN